MAENYLQKATQIYRGFDAESSREWLRKNGMTELAKMLLNDMTDARSEEDFKKAEYQFKNRIVVPFFKDFVYPRGEKAVKAFVAENPIINVAPPKSVGSYDDLKKNQAFADSKYVRRYTDEKGETRVNVPLLQIANDPEELSLAALRLGITPEDLHDHIENEWKRKKEKEWPKIEAAMKKEMLANRGKVLKEYDKNFWSGVLRSVAPEMYAGMQRDIAEGKGEAGSIPGWLGEHKKDVLLDAGRNAALAMTGYAANPIATGTAITGTEIATLAGSDYYPLNLKNATFAAITGYTAASIPSAVGKVVGAIGKFGGPFYKASRNTMRKLRRGEELPSQTEQKSIYDKIDHAYSVFYDIKNNPRTTGFDGNDVKSAVNEIFDMVKNSPNFPIPEGTLDTEAGRESIKKAIANLLNSKEGVMELKRGLTAPSRNRYLEWNNIVNNPSDNPETFFFAKQNLEKTKILFPEVVNEIKLVDEIGPGQLDKIVNWGTEKIGKAAYKYGSIAEPIVTRALYDESLDTYAKKHPELIEKWKYEGIPQWDPFSQEFAEQYPDANGVKK